MHSKADATFLIFGVCFIFHSPAKLVFIFSVWCKLHFLRMLVVRGVPRLFYCIKFNKFVSALIMMFTSIHVKT